MDLFTIFQSFSNISQHVPSFSIRFPPFPQFFPFPPDRWTGARPAVPAAPAQTIHPSPPPSRCLRPSHVRSRPHPPHCFEPEIHQLWSLWSWAGSIGVSWKGVGCIPRVVVLIYLNGLNIRKIILNHPIWKFRTNSFDYSFDWEHLKVLTGKFQISSNDKRQTIFCSFCHSWIKAKYG